MRVDMVVRTRKYVLLWVALLCPALQFPAPAWTEHAPDTTSHSIHNATVDSVLDRRGVSEGDLFEGKEHDATGEVSDHRAHDVLDHEIVLHHEAALHHAGRRSSLENGTPRGAQPRPINSVNPSSSADASSGLTGNPSESVNITKQSSTTESSSAGSATLSTELDWAELDSATELEVTTEEGGQEEKHTAAPSDTTEPQDEVTEANVAEPESTAEKESATEEVITSATSDTTTGTADTYTTRLQEDEDTEEEEEEEEEAEVLKPVKVEKKKAKSGCKRTCLRKCCPADYVYDMDMQACRRTPEGGLMRENVALVVGFPACRENLTVVPELSTDGKSRLKLGSYSVKHEFYCSDNIIQGGKEATESLMCEDKLEESRIVNIIRRTSIIGNIVSALSITFIYLCHIFIPKLNEKQGCLFLFFCTAVFAKAAFEAPGRAVKFRAYPNYTVCVINSLLLMFARASVPIWLSVLSIDIARKASCMSNLIRMINSQSDGRRWILIYIAYGLGLTFLEWTLALLLTNLSSHTQRQSVIYDRTCLFTDRDIRNYVFLYPSIGLMAICVLLMAYAHRYRKVWCSSTLVQGSRTVQVDLEGAEAQSSAAGDGRPGEGGVPDISHREIFRAHSAFDFVAGFWQQVSLVFFWVLLTSFMLLVQLTGRGVLAHITYLMDSFQGLYVFIIFICNRQKRVLVQKKVQHVYKIYIRNSTRRLTRVFAFRTSSMLLGHTIRKCARPTKDTHQGDPLSSVSTLELTSYPSKYPILPEESTADGQMNSSMYLSPPLVTSVCSGLSQMTEVPYVEDSSRETSPDTEEDQSTAQVAPPSEKSLSRETPVDELSSSFPEALGVSGRPLSEEALLISKAINDSMNLDIAKNDTQTADSTSSKAFTSDSYSPEMLADEARSSDVAEASPDPKTPQSPETSTAPGAASIPTPPSSPETPMHQGFTSAETLLNPETRNSSVTLSASEAFLSRETVSTDETPFSRSYAFSEISELNDTASSFQICPSPEGLITPEATPSVGSSLSTVTPPSSETPSIDESSPDYEVPPPKTPPLPHSFSYSEVPEPTKTSSSHETSSNSHSPTATPYEPSLSKTSFPESFSFLEVSSEVLIPPCTSHAPPISHTPKDPPLHQVLPKNSPSHENFPNSHVSPEGHTTVGRDSACDGVIPPSGVISNCLRNPSSSNGPSASSPLQLTLDGAVETETTWL